VNEKVIWEGGKENSMILVHIPNQWILFFAHSDWLLKLGMVPAFHLPEFSGFRAQVFPLLRKVGTFWCWISTGLVYTQTIIHFSVSEEWSDISLAASWLGKDRPLFTSTSVNN